MNLCSPTYLCDANRFVTITEARPGDVRVSAVSESKFGDVHDKVVAGGLPASRCRPCLAQRQKSHGRLHVVQLWQL